MTELPTTKNALRQYFMDKRKILEKNNKRALDLDIESRLLMSPLYRACDTVLVYIARNHEIATAEIIAATIANGKRVAAPVCTDDGNMQFRLIRSMSDLVPGHYGIHEPDERCPLIKLTERCLCVCPALACDMRGYRLGFGGGYYDRFLRSFPGVKAGLCYSDSVVTELPVNPYDVPLDAIFTDSYVRYHHKEES